MPQAFAGRMSNSGHLCIEKPLTVLGEMEVKVKCNNQSAHLPVLAMKGTGPNLLNGIGLDTTNWMKTCNSPLNDLGGESSRRALLFGTLEGFKATLYVNPQVSPRFFKARPVPYALREKIDQGRGIGTVTK